MVIILIVLQKIGKHFRLLPADSRQLRVEMPSDPGISLGEELIIRRLSMPDEIDTHTWKYPLFHLFDHLFELVHYDLIWIQAGMLITLQPFLSGCFPFSGFISGTVQLGNRP